MRAFREFDTAWHPFRSFVMVAHALRMRYGHSTTVQGTTGVVYGSTVPLC